jgi:pyridoxine 5-phosphate synthase
MMNLLMMDAGSTHSARTALSVNVNKVALLRNTRSLGIPSVVRAATLALEAGAQGITVHPRPDERHIRRQDVFDLAELMQAWPQAEFNIEGNPLHNLMDIAAEVHARGLPLHQLTFVPDSVSQATSDHGWQFPQDAATLAPLVAQAMAWGVRVSLFMDPQPESMAAVQATGAQRVELYTEHYARSHGRPEQAAVVSRYVATAQAALRCGLQINAGHDLNQANLADFLRGVPGVLEVSIGHALVADALEFGMGATVRDYLRCIHLAQSAG